ncbi:TetR/AcrR family transcriptional regulator [Amycolatopsis acidicola]|uniref:TetR/AcrR family transcriptional regulator n=1 Tax=Amycolatopsis acidicola TaxID=2596893 RepID=A0A5N0USY7_9PSEU|nr:TetR/AcrR family transcriptional regulator [Amycolatopsis acidicola]KAA9154288.1 TetR/AcrR family transcriptional regulator [Amycolatopsis acidicola]
MARPRIPLISRDRALSVALEIIDARGLEGLSIRRLAQALGVNGASLYHHFRDKDEIVAGAAELALAELRAAGAHAGGWRRWLPESVRHLRQALLAHPALVPVVARHRSLGMGARVLDTWAARLMEEGVPSAAVMPLLDALELFAISSALHETHGAAVPVEGYPALAKATAERGLSSAEIHDLVAASIIDAIDVAVEQRQARWLPGNAHRRAAPTS